MYSIIKSRVAHIEGKLDGLVRLIKSVQVPRNDINSLSSLNQHAPPKLVQGRETAMGLPISADHSDAITTPRTSQSTYQPPGAYPTNGHYLDLEEANTLLDTFRNQIASRFPFVAIPQTVTAQELSQLLLRYSNLKPSSTTAKQA